MVNNGLWYYFKLGCKTVYDSYFLRGMFVYFSIFLLFSLPVGTLNNDTDNKRENYNFDMGVIGNIITRISDLFNTSSDYFSFKYEDIYIH